MPREGYTNALAALLEGAVAIARPIIEILDVIASAVINNRQEFQSADSGDPALNIDPIGFHTFDAGGVRLEGIDAILSSQTASDGDGVPGDHNPSTTTLPIDCAAINWGGVAGAASILFESIELRIQNGTGIQAADFYHCQLFRCHSWERVFDTTSLQRWTVEPLTQVVTVPAGNAGALTFPSFVFADDVIQIPIGAAPIVGENPADPLLPEEPTTICVWWATRANGDLQPGAVWESTIDADPPSPPDPRRFRFLMNPTGVTYQWDATIPNAGGGNNEGVPYYVLHGRTYTEQTIDWIINPVDLGKAPDADSLLSLVASISEPGDSVVFTGVSDGITNSGGFVPFVDGQTIADLGMVRQQTYLFRGILTPSSDAASSPRLMRIGITEVTSTLVDDQVDIASADWTADPLTLQSEVPTMAVHIRRDGILDYRSWGEDLISGTPFSSQVFRIWLGHPTLARNDWFLVDDFVIRNYDPSGDGLAISLVSPLSLQLAEIPELAGPIRLPIEYVAATVEDVWRDLLDQISAPARYIGGGPTDQNLVTNTIDTVRQVIDVRQEIDFIAGGVTISSQGVWKWVSMFGSSGFVATIERGDYILKGYDIGTDRRAPEVDIAYNSGTEEKQYIAADAIVSAFGTLGTGETLTVNAGVAQWLPDATLPDIIGPRIVNSFGTGVAKMRISCRTPRPFLELGDLVNVQEDRFVGYDPVAQSGNRGEVFRSARVVGIHDIFGRELTLYVSPFVTGTTQLSEPVFNALGTGRTAVQAWGGDDFRAARWPEDLATIVGMGNIVGVYAAWEWWGGAVTVTAQGNGSELRAVLPLPLLENVFILEAQLIVDIPVGTLTAELIEYPGDGSPGVVLASFSFTDTVGREQETVMLPPPGFNVDGDATYSVEAVTTIDDGDLFRIHSFALKIRELF